jgi:hypothetical protein
MFDWLLGKRVLIVRIHVYPPGAIAAAGIKPAFWRVLYSFECGHADLFVTSDRPRWHPATGRCVICRGRRMPPGSGIDCFV